MLVSIKDLHSTFMWDGSFFVEDERGRREEGRQLCGLRKRRPNPNTMNRREADQGKKQKSPKKNSTYADFKMQPQ